MSSYLLLWKALLLCPIFIDKANRLFNQSSFYSSPKLQSSGSRESLIYGQRHLSREKKLSKCPIDAGGFSQRQKSGLISEDGGFGCTNHRKMETSHCALLGRGCGLLKNYSYLPVELSLSTGSSVHYLCFCRGKTKRNSRKRCQFTATVMVLLNSPPLCITGEPLNLIYWSCWWVFILRYDHCIYQSFFCTPCHNSPVYAVADQRRRIFFTCRYFFAFEVSACTIKVQQKKSLSERGWHFLVEQENTVVSGFISASCVAKAFLMHAVSTNWIFLSN